MDEQQALRTMRDLLDHEIRQHEYMLEKARDAGDTGVVAAATTILNVLGRIRVRPGQIPTYKPQQDEAPGWDGAGASVEAQRG